MSKPTKSTKPTKPHSHPLARFTLACYDRGSRYSTALERSIRLYWPFSKTPARFGLELFVALALTVNFFYLVKTQAAIKPNGNMFPAFTFAYLIDNQVHSGELAPANWRARLAAPAVSGWFLKTQFKDYDTLMKSHPTFSELCRSRKFQNVFGLYHSAWLFLLFVSLICLRKDALFLMLGVFAGLMYNLTGPAGNYYFPWDMPALFFFTLACLLFDKGWMKILIPVVVIGSLFKETILCCSLFILLGSHWTWPRRLAAFLATLLATFGLNHLLMARYGVHASTFAMNGATSLTDLVNHTLLYKNLHLLFSLNLNHVLFANAGALFLMMLVPWQSRRDVLFKLVILAFGAGQFLYGIIDEVRVWYELLPLGWIILSDALARPTPTPADPTARLFRGSHWISLAGPAVILLALLLIVKPDPATANNTAGKPIPPGLLAAAQKGDINAQYQLGFIMASERLAFVEGAEWFSKASAQGHFGAQYNLGLMYFDGMGVAEDRAMALELFRKAAVQGSFEAQMMLGKVCQNTETGNPDFIEAYKWLKLATLQKNLTTSAELQACAARMTPDQIAAAEQQVKEIQATRK